MIEANISAPELDQSQLPTKSDKSYKNLKNQYTILVLVWH